MEEERVALADILTPQEHNWFGSTSEFSPTTEEEWHIPDGILRGKITLEQAVRERRDRRFVRGMAVAPLIGIFDRTVVISLEEINEITRQTREDPKILGILNPETDEVVPAIDKTTGQVRDLTAEFIEKSRERGLEEELHLRPRSTGEGQNPSLGEGNTDYRK